MIPIVCMCVTAIMLLWTCVWRDGVDLCFECNKKEANKKETK